MGYNYSTLSVSVFSLQEFEADYQELWDWLMDMDAMVTDSHQLMMSEEQRHHLFKVRRALLFVTQNLTTLKESSRWYQKVFLDPLFLSASNVA